MLIRYVDGVYVFATNQAGQYGDQSFVAFIDTRLKKTATTLHIPGTAQ